MALFPASSIGESIKSFDVSVPAASTFYNFGSEKPSDFGKVLGAFSLSGGGCIVIQVTPTIAFFKEATSSNLVLRIIYQTT